MTTMAAWTYYRKGIAPQKGDYASMLFSNVIVQWFSGFI